MGTAMLLPPLCAYQHGLLWRELFFLLYLYVCMYTRYEVSFKKPFYGFENDCIYFTDTE
jgi:hypothetical protein